MISLCLVAGCLFYKVISVLALSGGGGGAQWLDLKLGVQKLKKKDNSQEINLSKNKVKLLFMRQKTNKTPMLHVKPKDDTIFKYFQSNPFYTFNQSQCSAAQLYIVYIVQTDSTLKIRKILNNLCLLSFSRIGHLFDSERLRFLLSRQLLLLHYRLYIKRKKWLQARRFLRWPTWKLWNPLR